MSPDIPERWANREDLALLTDLYQLTMLYGYWRTGRHDVRVSFEYFFRALPPHTGFAISCGLEQFLDYLDNLHFTDGDIQYLESLQLFDAAFLAYLRHFRPHIDVFALPEGTVVFPHQPTLRIEGPLAETQLVETAVLNCLNYATLVATKTARVRQAAGNDYVMEFGVRRAQGPDGGLTGSRASYVGGADATSNVLAGRLYGIPVRGTHAHSWVMSFPDELSAFRAYAETYPESTLLLVDTYDTLTSGLPHAIEVFKELRAAGHAPQGAVRLDSGDLAKLSKAAHQMFLGAGFNHPTIVASNELDEDLIVDLKRQGAKINSWGVGTNLITASNHPALGGIYKLVAVVDEGGRWQPRLKLSSNPTKMTDPGRKQVVRYRDAQGHPLGDILYLMEEEPASGDRIPYVGREAPTFRRVLEGAVTFEPLLCQIVQQGRRLEPSPPLELVRSRAQNEIRSLPDEYRRLRNPHIYEVGLSPRLGLAKARLIREAEAEQMVMGTYSS
ncbi:MAG: nicotinate phosphoribosyltransferase [Actinobacteria bacterium]|nr:nicotinate phosphoribosyltransferase [Actinomycetota bacterium]